MHKTPCYISAPCYEQKPTTTKIVCARPFWGESMVCAAASVVQLFKKWQFPNILKSLPSYAYMNHARWNWYKSAIITKRSSWKLCGLLHEYFLLSEQYTELWPRCLLLKFCFFFFFFSPLLLGCAIVMRDMMQLQFLSITETVLFFSYSALLIITQSYNVSRV